MRQAWHAGQYFVQDRRDEPRFGRGRAARGGGASDRLGPHRHLWRPGRGHHRGAAAHRRRACRSAGASRARYRCRRESAAPPPARIQAGGVAHDPEKWEPVSGQDHAQDGKANQCDPMNDETAPRRPYRFIGKPLPRKEDERLVIGKGRFTDDFNLDGEVHAAMVRSPHPHARIVAIDVAAAKAMPRVLGIFTGADCAADGLAPIPHDPVPKTKYDMKLTGPGGGSVFAGPHVLLPADRVRHVGEAVAMVVAATRAQALDAAEAVVVRYQELPFVLHSEDAMAAGASALWDEAANNICVDTSFGDAAATDQAFARATHVVRRKFHIGRVTGVPLEPRAALGAYDAATGRYTLYAGSGGAVRQKRELATVLGVAPESLRVLSYDVGGNFGTRNRVFVEFGLVLCAAKKLGRPVKFTATRAEAFLSDYQGRDLVRRDRTRPRPGWPHAGDARHQHQQCRRPLRFAVAVEQGGGTDPGLLCHSGGAFARARGLHQHHADAGLSQFRAAGSDLCDRAPRRYRRR